MSQGGGVWRQQAFDRYGEINEEVAVVKGITTWCGKTKLSEDAPSASSPETQGVMAPTGSYEDHLRLGNGRHLEIQTFGGRSQLCGCQRTKEEKTQSLLVVKVSPDQRILTGSVMVLMVWKGNAIDHKQQRSSLGILMYYQTSSSLPKEK